MDEVLQAIKERALFVLKALQSGKQWNIGLTIQLKE